MGRDKRGGQEEEREDRCDDQEDEDLNLKKKEGNEVAEANDWVPATTTGACQCTAGAAAARVIDAAAVT